MTHHAFVDESVRPGRYLMTAVLVPSRELAAVTKEVRSLFPRGNRRTHLSSENVGRRRMFLRGYAALGLGARVCVASYTKGDDREARDQCLGAIFSSAPRWKVGVVILDSRGADRDRADRRSIAEVIRGQPRPPQYSHRGSRDEPLLCLPDAIGWAVGAGGPWRRLVDPVISEIIELGG